MSFLNNIDLSNLSVNEKNILAYFKKNELAIPYMSLNEICKELYVSSATIIRFTQKLGFKGFNDFKFQIRNENSIPTNIRLSSQIIQHDSAVIKDYIDSIDENLLNRLSKLTKEVEHIYIYGRDMSSLPAKYLFSLLNVIDIRCIFIDWLDFLHALSTSFPMDTLLFLFVNHGRVETYGEIIKACQKRDVRIVWISSEEIAPSLIGENDIYLYAPEVNQNHGVRTKMTSFALVQLLVENIRLQS